jgi:hypothetical protein
MSLDRPSSVQLVERSSESTVVGQSQAGGNVSTEAEGIVVNRHQATTGGDTAGLEDLVRAVVNCRVCELVIAL